MTTFTTTRPGPVLLALDLDHGDISVTVEDREYAEITLTPLHPGDQAAAELIERTTTDQRGQSWMVTVPAQPETASFGNGAVVVNQVASTVTGVMVGVTIDSSGGITFGTASAVFGRGKVRAEVRLPRGSSVQASTITANLATAGALERVRFQSTAGDLSAAAVGELHADTTSGDVTAWQTGTARVGTASGDIRLVSTASASVTTMSGDVRLTLQGGQATARTMSGNVAVYATEPSTVDVNTMSGNVRLGAEPGVSLRDRVRTMSGRITRDL